MKRILGMLVAGVLTGGLVIAGQTPAMASQRTGALHVTKECSQYTGAAGSFCTITGSNVKAIKPGAKVVYAQAANVDGTLDSDVVIDNGHCNVLFGHVTLNATRMVITLHGGTGVFRHFSGRAKVTVTDSGTPQELWHWDGYYSLGSHGHESS